VTVIVSFALTVRRRASSLAPAFVSLNLTAAVAPAAMVKLAFAIVTGLRFFFVRAVAVIFTVHGAPPAGQLTRSPAMTLTTPLTIVVDGGPDEVIAAGGGDGGGTGVPALVTWSEP
jgi:hypothetical protein